MYWPVYFFFWLMRRLVPKKDRFLISDEGRALIDAFGPGDVLTSPAKMGSIRTYGSYAFHFYAPERAKNNETTIEGSAWSFGCLLYEVFRPPVNWVTHLKITRCFHENLLIISTQTQVTYGLLCPMGKLSNAPALPTTTSTRSTTNFGN
jgi:hypothetical protein